MSGAHGIDAAALGVMKPAAYLVNVVQGGCVDEAVLRAGRIARAALVEPPIGGVAVMDDAECLAHTSYRWGNDPV